MATMNSPAIRRLLQDLKQLKKEPVVGANAEPFGDNLMIWYGLVIGVEGTPYAGIPVRFTIEFSDKYPREAPNVFFDTPIPYTEGSTYEDGFGRQYICLNLFGNTTASVEEYEGWSPSYTVQTILLSMQALMMSDMLSDDDESIQTLTEAALTFRCGVTGHIGSEPDTWFPKVITNQNVIQELCAKTVATEAESVAGDPLQDFYICYVNKTTAKDGAALGYGILVFDPDKGTLSSPCEYLSYDAYENGTRYGSTNKPFDFWLPVLIHSNQWPRIRRNFISTVHVISKSFTNFNTHAPTGRKVFKICSSIMNRLVLEIMQNEEQVTANDKFINAYISFYRLLFEYSKEDPTIVQMADYELKNFIDYPVYRSKSRVPNLGEFLTYLLISSQYSWKDLAKSFISECDARDVFDYAIGDYDNSPKYPELASESARGRCEKVFEATKVSRNLVMFQVRFAKVAKGLEPELMDSNFGLAPDELRSELKNLYNLMSSVASWNDYYRWLDMPRTSDQIRERELLTALKISRQRGYHSVTAKGG